MTKIQLNKFILYFNLDKLNLDKENIRLHLFSSKYYANIKTNAEFNQLITSSVVYNNIIMFNIHKHKRITYISFHISDDHELSRLSTAKMF